MSDGVVAPHRISGAESTVTRLLRWVKNVVSTRREPYHPSSEPFLELDLREVRAQLRHRERGHENGERDIPPTDAVRMDQVERDIVAFVVGEQNRAHNQCQQQLQVFSERIRSMEIQVLHSNIAGRVQAACADLRALALRGRNELFDLQRQVASLARELATFRVTHRLQREAQYPESRIWHWAILTTILLTEAALNGTMLSRGTIGGLSQAFGQAIALAAINISIGAVLGRVGIPLLHHRQGSRRITGAIVLIAGIPACIAFNLAVGHYRDSLAVLSTDDAARDALRHFVTAPFALADFNSWALFVLGLVFTVIATIDTYRMDDPYWSYGNVTRRYQLTRDDFISERQVLMDEAIQERDEALDEIHRVAEQISRVGQHITSLLGRQQLTVEKFRGFQEYLDRTGALLLSEYRAENERSRHTPPPPHFRQDWRLSQITVRPVPTVPDGLEPLAKSLQKLRTAIMTAFDEAIAEIKSVQDLVDDATAEPVGR